MPALPLSAEDILLHIRDQSLRTDAQVYSDHDALKVLWAIFAFMIFCVTAFSALTYSYTPLTHGRLHGFVMLAALGTAVMAYWAMAAAEGQDTVSQGPNDNKGFTRQVFFARYIMWSITTPLILFSLMLLAGLDFYTMAFVIFSDLAYVLTRLFGALDDTNFRWGWYVMSWFWLVPIIYHLVAPGSRAARARSAEHASVYGPLMSITVACWIVYPIVWGLADGGNTIGLTAEHAWYGGLDIISHGLFGFILLFNLRKLEKFHPGSLTTGTVRNTGQMTSTG
ncbi:ion channel activity protein [Borealophlyctis nickersoniae]|nr:ion channel activity protein [Borealophlyctis nickersoniae]